MKKIVITAAICIFSLGAWAQATDDMLQQQAPRETQVEVERSAARDAQQKEIERKAKEAEEAKRREAREAKRKEAELKKKSVDKPRAKPKTYRRPVPC
jgi:septal ring factor EnvC (AmiA/AmiB activator)